jgi:hypothetical protein
MRRLGAVRRSTPRGRASATHGLAAPEQASARGEARCAAARRAHAGAAAYTSGARSVSGCIAPLRRSFAGQEGRVLTVPPKHARVPRPCGAYSPARVASPARQHAVSAARVDAPCAVQRASKA